LHIPSNSLLFLVMAHLATTPPVAPEAVVERRRRRVRERPLDEAE
jgi:hypothetical protein